MNCPLCAQTELARAGRHERLIGELDETFALLSERQGLWGWCVLVLREHAEHLGELSIERQKRIFGDVARVAGAIRSEFATTGAGGGPVRINYECLGNQAAHVHWHVIPRHADDPDPRNAIWGWSEERLRGDRSATEVAELVKRLSRRVESFRILQNQDRGMEDTGETPVPRD